jgi:PAS domain S-box-containing protein
LKAIVAVHEPALAAEIGDRLAARGFAVRNILDLSVLEAAVREVRPSLVVLQQSGGAQPDALPVCRRLCRLDMPTPLTIWVVGATFSGPDLAAWIEAGADDCIRLPLAEHWSDVRVAALARQRGEARRLSDAERALEQSIERFDLAVRGANEGLWDAVITPGVHWSSPETPVWFSDRVRESLGFQPDEFPNVLQSWSERLHPDDQPRVFAALTDHVERRKPYDIEYRLLTKQGEYRWYTARGQGIWGPNGELLRMAGSLRDVTDAHVTAEKLRASEQKWRGLVQNAPDIVTVIGLDGTIQFINRVGPGGYTVEQLIGMDIHQFARPEDQDEVRTKFAAVAATGEPQQLESQVINPDGTMTWYSSRIGPIIGQRGVEALVLITTDITTRRRAEEERQRSFALVENSGDFIGMMTPEGQLLYLNPAGCALVGLADLAAAEAAPMTDFYTEPCRRRFLEIVLPEVLSAGRWSGEMQFVHRLSDKTIDVHQKVFAMSPPQAGAPPLLATITRDITERTIYENDLRREQELLRRLLDLQERERQLVAYEIHDGIVQEMTASLMHLDAYRHHSEPSNGEAEFDRARKLLRTAVDEARRLISGLRPPVLDELGIVAAVEYLINEARPYIPTIEYEHNVTPDRLAPPLESAVFRIVQEALSNIRKHSGSKSAVVKLLEHDGRLLLEVRDAGRGFHPEKVSGERFGLQGIRQRARLLGTTAEIISAPGQGTVVRVDLPLIREPEESVAGGGEAYGRINDRGGEDD